MGWEWSCGNWHCRRRLGFICGFPYLILPPATKFVFAKRTWIAVAVILSYYSLLTLFATVLVAFLMGFSARDVVVVLGVIACGYYRPYITDWQTVWLYYKVTIILATTSNFQEITYRVRPLGEWEGTTFRPITIAHWDYIRLTCE